MKWFQTFHQMIAPDQNSSEEDRIWPAIDEAAVGMGRLMDGPTEEEEDRMDAQSDCYVSRGKWISK